MQPNRAGSNHNSSPVTAMPDATASAVCAQAHEIAAASTAFWAATCDVDEED